MNSILRKIIHIDMDAFYASVEQRDHAAYRGKPLVVGGSPHSRGVVATCSYEARKFGIHSAMPARTAYSLCPDAIFVKPRMEVYRHVSQDIMAVFRSYTDLVEPLSLDEAFLDVTENHKGILSGTLLAREIKQRIYEVTGLTASAGVSYTKFLAKLASDYHKPDGLYVIPPEQAQAFLDALPIRKFFGIGKVTEQRLLQLNIQTGFDLRQKTLQELISIVSDRGRLFYDLVRGIDPRPVQPDRIRQSIGKESTLQVDIDDREEMLRLLRSLSEAVEQALLTRSVRAHTVVLKIKYSDFEQITRRMTTEIPVQAADEIFGYVHLLFKQVALRDSVRLLGVSVQKLQNEEEAQWVQLRLFEDERQE